MSTTMLYGRCNRVNDRLQVFSKYKRYVKLFRSRYELSMQNQL